MKMNSTRYSRVVLLCLVGLVALAGTASAFSVSATSVPSDTAVGEEVSVTYTIDDPYTDVPDEWTLFGQTQLESVSWTVTVFDRESQVYEETFGTQSFNQSLDGTGAQDGDEVVVELTGTVPAIEGYSYQPEESYTVAELSRVTGSNQQVFVNDSSHHYTSESREARTAIQDATAAINATGGNSEAEQLRDNAISSYENGNFNNSIDLAQQAQNTAEQAQQSQQTTQTLLYAGIAVVVLVIVGGLGFYLYSQSGGDDYSKL
jgi:hypothetical protein